MRQMSKKKWEKVIEVIKGKHYEEFWQEEIKAECETDKAILFSDFEKWAYHEDTRFVYCREKNGKAGYLLLEIGFGDEDIIIVDALHKY